MCLKHGVSHLSLLVNWYEPICISVYMASSGVALGRMPGSLNVVCRSMAMTKVKSAAAMTGMAIDRRFARYGQLKSI